jgi:hypothetical protein
MIKNLSLQLNEAGKIKIGVKGKEVTSKQGKSFRPPERLDHFQITTTEKDENGDYIVDVALQNRIIESGTGIVNADGHLIGLPIRLLYDDTELNFPTQYVSYVSGQRSCSGDGEVSRKRIDDYQVDHPCPCPRVEQGYEGKDKCKPTGTLAVVLDDAGLFGQAHKFRTTSMNSIKGILGGMELIKTATNGRIAGLPLMLALTQKQTVTPGGPSTIYVVSVCYRGNLADLKTEALRIMMDEKQFLLAMNNIAQAATKQDVCVNIVNGSDDEKDFVEEFFPDAVEPVAGTDDKKTEPEPETNVDQSGAETTEESKETETVDIPSLKPVGSYGKIYESFINELDIDKAMALANRLQKGNLFYHLETNHPDVNINPKMLKPELLELVHDCLKQALPVEQEAETQPTEQIEENAEQLDTGDQTDINTSDQSDQPASAWDDSGPIVKDQLRRLVQLKTQLEKQGVLRPDKWSEHVQFFTDANGEKITTAVKLTKNQGDTFIKMLESAIKEEDAVAA